MVTKIYEIQELQRDGETWTFVAFADSREAVTAKLRALDLEQDLYERYVRIVAVTKNKRRVVSPTAFGY